MAAKQLPSETIAEIKRLRGLGFSRQVVADSLGTSVRQIVKVDRGATPEKLAKESPRQYKESTKRIRESFVRNAEKMGVSTKLRGNDNFRRFAEQMEKQDRVYARIQVSMVAMKDWRRERIMIYYNNGLITEAQKDHYLALQG